MRGPDVRLTPDDSAVTELTSVLTLLVIAAVIIAAVGINVAFVDAERQQGPEAQFSFDYVQEQSTLIITHESGAAIRAGDLLIRGPDTEATWARTNTQVEGSTLIGPFNSTQIGRRNDGWGSRVRSNDRIQVLYANTTEGIEYTLGNWNGSDAL